MNDPYHITCYLEDHAARSGCRYTSVFNLVPVGSKVQDRRARHCRDGKAASAGRLTDYPFRDQ
jgi:hypothetical protein